MIARKKPIGQMSAKRAAEIKAAGLPAFSTFVRQGPRSAQREPKPRKTSTGPTRATVELVLDRDGHACVKCGLGLHGTRGVDYSIHHRKLRSQGGGHTADNLVAMCGHGSAGCHSWAHSRRGAAERLGLIVPSAYEPATFPLWHAIHGRVLLVADGSWQPIEVAA